MISESPSAELNESDSLASRRPIFSISRLLSWAVVIGCGLLIAWIVLAFFIVLPVDDSKVHPKLQPSEFTSPSLWLMTSHPDEAGIWLTDIVDSSVSFLLPAVGDEAQVMVIRNVGSSRGPSEETRVSLKDYPHTRRSIAWAMENEMAHAFDNSHPTFSEVTRDPFARTRVTIRSVISKIREWLEPYNP